MTQSRVIFRVPPVPYETIHGYLHRVAEENQLRDIYSILHETLGERRHHQIYIEDLLTLASYCRVYPDELFQLSGVVQRKSGGSLEWQVCGHRITKSSFIEFRQVKVCPLCLLEGAYVRGEWILSFYTSCAKHGCALVGHCHGCGRDIYWERINARYCGCGFDLSESIVQKSNLYAALCSDLIAYKIGQALPHQPWTLLRVSEFQSLDALSLDGLFKTIWFLGHCIGELGHYSTGHGVAKPKIHTANSIIEKAFSIVEDWPNRLGNELIATKDKQLSNSGMTLVDKLIGPVQSYYKNELQEPEFGFIVKAYERQVSLLRNSFGKKHRSSKNYGQYDFFD